MNTTINILAILFIAAGFFAFAVHYHRKLRVKNRFLKLLFSGFIALLELF